MKADPNAFSTYCWKSTVLCICHVILQRLHHLNNKVQDAKLHTSVNDVQLDLEVKIRAEIIAYPSVTTDIYDCLKR